MTTITVRRFRDFGAVIKAARESRGLRQDELAGELDITRQYLQDLENGRPNLYITRLLRAMNSLGITISVTYTPGRARNPDPAARDDADSADTNSTDD
ncbi:helix-turn-helix domain-containing protein [Salinibacterium sp. TMP30]|uniref:helix-turn-helix domain-containing protein n=1 Tax=Salinibacterium sp. TMP30 TaxID=3138237 RepID=UPI003138CE56